MVHGWDNFYITAAQAGGALIGLLFVAITVATGFSTASNTKGVRAFLTPTLVHFVGVLFISLAVLAPWPSPMPLGAILALIACAGTTYQIKVIGARLNIGRETGGDMAKAVGAMTWEEWIPYAILPAAGNASLMAGAVGLIAHYAFAPYTIAAEVAAQLISGIYAAWDLTLWVVRNRKDS
jgi:hypothetical protein